MGLEVMVAVSLGELLDKISILEIKAEQIVEADRLRNVRYELELLTASRDKVLGPLTGRLVELAEALKSVNQRIWDAEDVIHGPDQMALSEADFARYARICFGQNDVRARIKRQINDLSGSSVVEEKSYPDFGSTLGESVSASGAPNAAVQ